MHAYQIFKGRGIFFNNFTKGINKATFKSRTVILVGPSNNTVILDCEMKTGPLRTLDIFPCSQNLFYCINVQIENPECHQIKHSHSLHSRILDTRDRLVILNPGKFDSPVYAVNSSLWTNYFIGSFETLMLSHGS